MVKKETKMVEKSVRATCAVCKKDMPQGSYFILKKTKGRFRVLCEGCANTKENLGVLK